jgi:predicted transcriptional regulator
MSRQLSIRLDDEVHRELEEDARVRGVGLATYLRDLAAAHAKEVRRARIRAESQRVGELYHARTDVRDFYDTWGAPDPDVFNSRS